MRRGPTADKLLKVLRAAGLQVPTSTYTLEKFQRLHATIVSKSEPRTWPPQSNPKERVVAYRPINEVVEELLDPLRKRLFLEYAAVVPLLVFVSISRCASAKIR